MLAESEKGRTFALAFGKQPRFPLRTDACAPKQTPPRAKRNRSLTDCENKKQENLTARRKTHPGFADRERSCDGGKTSGSASKSIPNKTNRAGESGLESDKTVIVACRHTYSYIHAGTPSDKIKTITVKSLILAQDER